MVGGGADDPRSGHGPPAPPFPSSPGGHAVSPRR
jgi:hypothetical protein